MREKNSISKDKQKILHNWLNEFKNIIPKVSSWLKLLALIVLVAATFIIIAMIITPNDNPNFSLYPYALLGLLFIVIIGVFIDRQRERDFKQRGEGTLVRTDDNKLKIEEKAANSVKEKEQNYTDSRLGFKMYYPVKEDWQKPQFLSYQELLIKLGVITESDAHELLNTVLLSNPYGNMFVESDVIIFQYGKDLEIEFVDESTTQDIEDYLKRADKYVKEKGEELLSEEVKEKERKRLFLGGLFLITKLKFPISLSIQIFQKSLAISSMAKPNLPNLLKALTSTTAEPIEQLTSFENSIIWISRVKLLNVKVNGSITNFTIYRTYKLIETKEKLFLLQIQWSPESDSAIEVWNELSSMLDSFAVID